MGLMQSSQISWKIFLCHFLAPDLNAIDFKEPFYREVEWQNQFLQWLISALTKLGIFTNAPLPRVAGKLEEVDNLVHKILNSHFPLALTKITEEYKVWPQKIDLLTTDPEDYFKFSGNIELRLSYNAEDHRYRLRLLNRGDRLLLTCPTSIMRKGCSFPNHHDEICGCEYSTEIFCSNEQCEQQSPLIKNLTFLRWLWKKISGQSVLELSIEGKLGIYIKPEMLWKDSMTREFNIATFVVDDIIFTKQMDYHSFATLQFVGVE